MIILKLTELAHTAGLSISGENDRICWGPKAPNLTPAMVSSHVLQIPLICYWLRKQNIKVYIWEIKMLEPTIEIAYVFNAIAFLLITQSKKAMLFQFHVAPTMLVNTLGAPNVTPVMVSAIPAIFITIQLVS